VTTAGPLHHGHRAQLLALALAVGAAHLWLANQHLPPRLGDGAADTPKRIDVAFVRVLAPTQAPAAPAAPLRPTPRSVAAPQAGASAASAASAACAASVLSPPPEPPPPVEPPLPVPKLPAVATAPAVDLPPAATPDSTPATTPAAAASAPSQAAFEWPPSTRLSYTLTGDYRGPVLGQAQVEWLLSGSRYQVHLDISVGPSFAPLMSRRITSEGELTADGLQPRRYDEETKVALRDPRRLTIWLDADRVRLPAGTELPRPAAVQDSASQFVQMTWLFTTQPDRLRAGQSLSFPLALPRRVEPWIYDVKETEMLATPAGPVEAVHIKPRRDVPVAGELAAEFWVAPSLQYLPVRILIRQDAQTYVDLVIDRLPQQAERGR